MAIELTIDGQPVTSESDVTIWEAARRIGIEIPALCHHPDLSPVGSCRLCLVEIEGRRDPVASCVEPATNGLVVRTKTPALTTQRRTILELLMQGHSASENDQAQFDDNEFQKWLRQYKVDENNSSTPRFPVDGNPHPTIYIDLNQCILCTRCVRACAEVQGRFVWGVSQRGPDTRIVAGADGTMLDAGCESCGACVAYCPTDALTDRQTSSSKPSHAVTTTCAYCGVGCQFDLNVTDDRIVGVTANPAAPVNGMSLCVKGKYGWDCIHHEQRLLRPRVRKELLDGRPRTNGERGPWVEVAWDTALDLIAKRMVQVKRESGVDAIGLLSSAKCSNEENYLMQKLARQVLGTNNIDHCARLCHSSTVAGLGMSFGSGAMSNSMDDVAEQSAAMLVIGSNTTEQHPVFGAMIRQAVLKRGLKLVVADPRRIDLVDFAALHLRQRPGTDIPLINGLMHLILRNGWHDADFISTRCENFEDFRASIDAVDLNRVAEQTGVSLDDLKQAAELLARNKPMAVVWSMGITQHTTGVLNVLALANLQMLLGNVGVPGGGVNPLRGQNNVQGACDMGALPNVFPGYQAVTDASIITRFEHAWRLQHSNDAANGFKLPTSAGLTVTEMIDAAGSGDIRALYIVGENPAITDPDSNHVRECLNRAEFVVLQEIFPSETSQFADVLLPGTTFAERDGTFTNTERRVQRFHAAIPAQGEARPDWQIISDLARRVLTGVSRFPEGPHAGWDYETPREIMREIAAVTPSYAGLTYERLDAGERLQWPVRNEKHPGTPILHVGQFTRGLGRFHVVENLPPRELPDDEFPILLTTGRVLYHWHAGEMTRRSQPLSALCADPVVEIAPTDAATYGLNHGSTITLHSRRGRMQAVACVTDRVAPGVVFGNFHFPGEGNANNLTIKALDPISKIPEYKVCAVRIERKLD